MKEHQKNFNITTMCKIFGIDKSSYYHWIKAGSIVKKVDKKLNELIEIIFVQGRCNYGTRRIKDKLQQLYGLIAKKGVRHSFMQKLNFTFY